MSLETRIERIERFLSLTPVKSIAPGTVARVFAIRVIVEDVCAAMELSVEDVLSRSRRAEHFRARAAAAWLARRNLQRTWGQIAEAFNMDDHSAVIRQVRRADEMIATEPEFLAVVDGVSRRLFGKPIA
jgi:chromosomal replication initiation ATPase DnaA